MSFTLGASSGVFRALAQGTAGGTLSPSVMHAVPLRRLNPPRLGRVTFLCATAWIISLNFLNKGIVPSISGNWWDSLESLIRLGAAGKGSTLWVRSGVYPIRKVTL